MKKFTIKNSKFLIVLTLFVFILLIYGVMSLLVEKPFVRKAVLSPGDMPEISGISTPPPPLSPQPPKAGKRHKAGTVSGVIETEELSDFEFEEGGVEAVEVEGGLEEGLPEGFVSGVIGGLKGHPAEKIYPGYRKRADSTCPGGSAGNTEEYQRIYENPFLDALANPLSTFSIDVDSAAYANMRRFIKNSQLPPEDAVRIEELINYFDYDYPEPKGSHPFSIITEVSACPWNSSHYLLHIGLKGKKMKSKELPPSNLVFLLDVSGSMDEPNKLPLLKSCFKLLAPNLGDNDRVSIVVYAGAAGVVLPAVSGSEQEKIQKAIDSLSAGGSTAGGEGIELAYKIAAKNFIPGGNNRVILATDGDFNVGVSSTGALVRLIEEKKESGIFLTALGFGIGNYKDHRLEQLADKGNGNYYYIDSILEGRKVFVDEMKATLFTIAKDVKIQVEFNPAKVAAYRLLGYENRLLRKEDFKDDTKDAGEMGSGHTVTALYEIQPAGNKQKFFGGIFHEDKVENWDRRTASSLSGAVLQKSPPCREAAFGLGAPHRRRQEENNIKVNELKYQETKIKETAIESPEIVTVKLRYKTPTGTKSKLIEQPVLESAISSAASGNFRFSAAVAQFGLLLRDSQYKGESSFAGVLELAKSGIGEDAFGYRAEFIKLVEMCELLSSAKKATSPAN